MLKILLTLSLTISSLFSISSHPMLMGLTLLMINAFFSFLCRFLTKSSWISMVMFLIMVGGIMVIFTYSTSISSNELFSKLNWNALVIITFFSPLYINPKLIFCPPDNLSSHDLFNFEFHKMFFPINCYSTVFMFIFLLFVLFILMKMMLTNKGAMRKKY